MALVLGALAAGGLVVVRRRPRHRDERRSGAEQRPGATAGRAWNIPARPQPVADREPLLAAIATALQAGPPTVVQAADGQAGLGTTTAMIEFAHWHHGDYDIACGSRPRIRNWCPTSWHSWRRPSA